MGYLEKFPIGTRVRIAAIDQLRSYIRPGWRFHHPLDNAQLGFAEKIGTVKSVGFYHGGDVLYTLEKFPGTWHEDCLFPVIESPVVET